MPDLSHYIAELNEQIEPLIDKGEAQQALEILNAALEAKSGNLQAIAAILDLRGTLYYQFDHIDFAVQDFHAGLGALNEGGMDHELAGSLHASLGAAAHAQGKVDETIEHWHQAIQHY